MLFNIITQNASHLPHYSPLLYHSKLYNHICIELESSVKIPSALSLSRFTQILPFIVEKGQPSNLGKNCIYIYSKNNFLSIYRLLLKFTKAIKKRNKPNYKASELSASQKKKIKQFWSNLSVQKNFTIFIHTAAKVVPIETIRQLQTAPGLLCELRSYERTTAFVVTTLDESTTLLDSLKSLKAIMAPRDLEEVKPQYPFPYKSPKETLVSMLGSHQYLAAFILTGLSIALLLVMVMKLYFESKQENATMNESDNQYCALMIIGAFSLLNECAENVCILYWYVRSLIVSEPTEIASSVANQRLGRRERSQNELKPDYYKMFYQSNTDLLLSLFGPYRFGGQLFSFFIDLVRYSMRLIFHSLPISHPYISEGSYKKLGKVAFVFRIILILKQVLSIYNKLASCSKVAKHFKKNKTRRTRRTKRTTTTTNNNIKKKKNQKLDSLYELYNLLDLC